jgi:hypothetical protein
MRGITPAGIRQGLTLLAASAALIGAVATTEAAAKPNIILIVSDDFGFGDAGVVSLVSFCKSG